jgi:2'-5' RNA ligase
MAVRLVSTNLETAVLIIPPFEVQSFAAPIRRQAMPERWMQVPAHITLLYPFAAPAEVSQAMPRLRQALAAAEPFDVTLDHYGRFPTAVFLEPAEPQPLLDLHRHLAAAFPEYPIYGGEFGQAFHPHLTLVQSEDESGPPDLALPPTPSFTFRVDRVFVFVGDPEAAVPYVPLAAALLGPP